MPDAATTFPTYLAEQGRWQWLTAPERAEVVRSCAKRGLTAALLGLTPRTVTRWLNRDAVTEAIQIDAEGYIVDRGGH